MRNFYKFIMMLMGIFTITSCNNVAQEEPTEDVDFTIDYNTFECGSMSRTAETVYNQFFDEYIGTKKLCPQNYTLSFGTTMTVSAKWGDKKIFHLPAGNYKISGTSVPKTSNENYHGGDTLSLKFDETIAIDKNTTNVQLQAKYDSYLLIFEDTNIASIKIGNDYLPTEYRWTDLNKFNNYYYCFIQYDIRYYAGANRSYRIVITRKDGTSLTIDPTNLNFVKGKYYYFDDLSASFNIDPMTEG